MAEKDLDAKRAVRISLLENVARSKLGNRVTFASVRVKVVDSRRCLIVAARSLLSYNASKENAKWLAKKFALRELVKEFA